MTLPAASDLPTVTVFSDGERIGGQYQLLGIVITREVNRIPLARITLLDGDAAAGDFALSDTSLFVPGRKIEIAAGYHTHEETIFKGVAVRHGIRSRNQGGATLQVLCKDPVAAMTVVRRSATYVDMKDSEILEEILGRYDRKKEVAGTHRSHPAMVQYQATDWDFMLARAEANGHLVFVHDDGVSVGPPNPGTSARITLVYGATILDLEMEVDAESQLTAVKMAAWNPADQEPVETDGADPKFPDQGNLSASDLGTVLDASDFRLHHGGAVGEQELQAFSDGLRVRRSLARLRGRIRCQGVSAVAPGDVVELQGLGDRFNGNAYVTGVRHEITADNWVTDFQIGLSPRRMYLEDAFEDPAAEGLLPGIQGLQIGLVTQLENDPDGEHRVKVRLPLVNADGEGCWARVSTLDAGDNRGAFVRPQIGDEVVVGFLHQDPRFPVLLGALHSSANPPPLEASDDNPQKTYLSRNKIQLLLDDDAKRLHIEMPSGREVTLDDDGEEIVVKDKDGNVVRMNSDGVSVEAGADVSIKAKGDVKIEGVNVQIKAQADFKAEGGSGTEVSSNAVTTVKGSLVQIN